MAPFLSIITAVYDPPLDAFEDTIASVLAQHEQDWQWVLVDDCSPHHEVRERLVRLSQSDSRVLVHQRTTNGGIVAASADALARATGDFVALLDHDDVLVPGALSRVTRVLRRHADVDYVYSDQDLMGLDGRTHSPYRKPDWSPERFRHHMYTTHFSVLRRTLMNDVGGFRAGYDGSQDHDLVLRVTERARRVEHIPHVLYHWREVPGSAAADPNAKPWAWDAGVRAVQDHLDRVGISATVSRGKVPGLYKIDREPDLTTPVSIIIPTRGSTGRVRGRVRCLVTETIMSIREHTRHEAVEFVVVHDLETPQTVLDDLRALPGVDVVLVPFSGPFNFSAKCNLGAVHARHDVLLFLNDDMEAESPDFVEQLIAPLAEPGVGMTGAKLIFENLRIQHAGVAYGSGTIAHSHYGARHPDDVGPYGELYMNHEVTALTGACLAVRREVYQDVGGFSERLPMNYNDVDLSMKVRRLGLRLVWLHDVVLYHFESMTRSPVVHPWETDLIIRRWGDYEVVRERYSNNVH